MTLLVIVRSDKPQAKAFRRWVTGEVLPSIRKTGSYTQRPALHSDPVLAQLHLLAQVREEQLAQGERLASVETRLDTAPIRLDPEKQARIYAAGQDFGRVHPRGFAGAWGEFKRAFGYASAPLAKYDALPGHRYEEALSWLQMQTRTYAPQRALLAPEARA